MTFSAELQGVDEVVRLFNNMPRRMFEETKSIMQLTVLDAHSQITAYRGGLVNRTGALRRSMRTSVSGNDLNSLTGKVWTTSKYANIQEKGGTITAKRAYMNLQGAPYLNIPLSANKTNRGVMRQSAREVFQRGGYTFKSRSGKWFVRSGTGQLMFILVKEVVIPARLKMVKSAEDQIPTMISRLRNLQLE